MLIDEKPKRPHLYKNEWPWRVLPCETLKQKVSSTRDSETNERRSNTKKR